MPKFSIILPCYSELEPIQSGASGQRHFRGKSVQRAIKSVLNQQFPDWELIIVDDGCVDGVTPQILGKFAESDPRIKVFHKTNENRAIARNYGMDRATGEWLCWLDSDDEYSTNYLRQMDRATRQFPEYQIFNFGAMYHWPDCNTTVRTAFEPAIEGVGHEWFRAGHIVCGTFIFKRALWASAPEKYRIPDDANPFQFAARSHIPVKLDPVQDEFVYHNTPNPEGVFQDGVYRQGLSLGNPWGDDYCQFYYLTRDNHSKPLGAILYIVYPRAHEEDYDTFGEIYDTGVIG